MLYIIAILDNGIPIDVYSHLDSSFDRPMSRYIIEDLYGKYKAVDKEVFLMHHNFDFTKGFEKTMYYSQDTSMKIKKRM